MKVVLILLCLVLIQIFSANAEDQNTELRRDVITAMGRQVREAGQKVKNKSSKKEKKGKKNAKVSRKNKSNPMKKKKSKKANGRKNKSKPRGKKRSKKTNGRKNKSKPRGKKRSKKANGRKNKSNPRGKKKSKKANGRTDKSKPRGTKKSKKSNGRKNKSKARGKKKSKKANGRKNGKGRSMGKKKSEKNKSGGKLSKTARETDAECLTIQCEKSRKFNVYQTQLRKAKRIKKWVDLMGKKKEKAMTTFQNASSAIQKATSNCTQCDGGVIPEEAKVACETLPNCSTTASELCDSSTIPGLDISLITECEPLLEDAIKAYKLCLEEGCKCSCFSDLGLVDDSCTKFDVMETKTKAARKKCTKPTEEGSFGYCRQQERAVAYYGEKCKFCPPWMTTKAPGVTARKQRQFQKLAWKM